MLDLEGLALGGKLVVGNDRYMLQVTGSSVHKLGYGSPRRVWNMLHALPLLSSILLYLRRQTCQVRFFQSLD
ncbi:unnamed protein product [Sphenostylis stenocarpa]|uniref:Uncharacterized protein n=1 Tax=Sphenostylis stenocarpa TaxID=92480 RepID=A0AA86SLV8_9FABA|nr:unnamed protein product [Sphenostylis stenocarpa]